MNNKEKLQEFEKQIEFGKIKNFIHRNNDKLNQKELNDIAEQVTLFCRNLLKNLKHSNLEDDKENEMTKEEKINWIKKMIE